MKKITIFFILIIFFISCSRKSHDFVKISGKIENPNSKELKIYNQNQDIIKIIQLKSDNTFSDTVKISEGYYWLSDGKERTKVYLKPGYDLNLHLDTTQFDETIQYSGIGAEVNNYLAKKFLLEESFGNKTYYGYFAKLDEKDFLHLVDSLYSKRMDLLRSFPNIDKDFAFAESINIKYRKLNRLADYERMKAFVTKNYSFKVSKDYPDPYKDVDFSNDKLLVSPYYISFIDSYFKNLASKKMKAGKDFPLEYVNTVIDSVKNEKIRDKLLYDAGRGDMEYTSNLDEFYNRIKMYLKNKKYMKELTERYLKMKKLAKGNPSPEFELEDINGNIVTLKQFRGKVVYIDIWAPWCMPCIYEIPNLKELEEYYKDKNIVFISICESVPKKDWLNAIKKYELKGIQLYTDDIDNKFLKDYMVSGIPRFILIDKEGKIIEANAKRPSNPDLKKVIDSYL